MKIAFLVLGLVLLFCVSGFAQVCDDGTPVGPVTNGFKMPFASGSLTTHFNGGNGFAGNLFDITPTNSLSFEAIDIHSGSSAGTALIMDVYWKDGTSVGFETDPLPWTLIGSFNATSAGIYLPTYVDMTGATAKVFDAGMTYGICVHCQNYATTGSIKYTNGAPTVFSNADLSLLTNCSQHNPAFTGYNPDRVWNGTIYYNSGNLEIDIDQISATTGGSVQFKLSPGVSYSGKIYLMLGSVTGTSPGTPVKGGAVMPINFDLFTNLVLAYLNTPLFDKFTGIVDATGQASATFTAGSPLPPNAIGLKMNFAFAVKDNPWMASNAVEVTIVP